MGILWLDQNGEKLAVLSNGALALVNGDAELGDPVFAAGNMAGPNVSNDS